METIHTTPSLAGSQSTTEALIPTYYPKANSTWYDGFTFSSEKLGYESTIMSHISIRQDFLSWTVFLLCMCAAKKACQGCFVLGSQSSTRKMQTFCPWKAIDCTKHWTFANSFWGLDASDLPHISSSFSISNDPHWMLCYMPIRSVYFFRKSM